jgi:hypothetical protein
MVRQGRGHVNWKCTKIGHQEKNVALFINFPFTEVPEIVT